MKKSDFNKRNVTGKKTFIRGRLKMKKLGSGLGAALKAKPQSLHMYHKAGPVTPGDVIMKALVPVACTFSDIGVLVYGDPNFEDDIKVNLIVLTADGSIIRKQKVTPDVIASFGEELPLDQSDMVTVELDEDSAQTGDILISFVASASGE